MDILHPRRFIGAGYKATLFVKGPFPPCTEQLDIADMLLLAAPDKLIQDFRTNALPLAFGSDD